MPPSIYKLFAITERGNLVLIDYYGTFEYAVSGFEEYLQTHSPQSAYIAQETVGDAWGEKVMRIGFWHWTKNGAEFVR